MRARCPLLVAVVLEIALLFSAAPHASPQQQAPKGGPQYYEDSEGYTLLSVVLEAEARSWGVKSLDISKRAVAPDMLSLCRDLPTEFQPAVDDLITRSKNVTRFRRRFSLRLPYSLTSGGATDVQISVVGFDPLRTHAVTVFRDCGSLCSGGWTYLFRKTETGWQKVGRVCEVMS